MPFPTFNSIVEYAEKNHNKKCPCTLKPEDFQSHDPTQSPNPESFLLLQNIPSETLANADQWEKLVRQHFMILAQKYHPDKNIPTLSETCHNVMTHLNKTYSDIIQKFRFDIHNSNEVIIDGKVFKKINNCTVTCRHLNSYSIYGFPDDVNQWRIKIKQMWGNNSISMILKARSSKKIGQQFGSENDSIYISVYDNGTIHVQGIMAIQYSEEIIIPLLTEWFKPKSEIVDKKRFSDLLKKAMGYFKQDSTQKPPFQSTTKRIEAPPKATHSTVPLKQCPQTSHQQNSSLIKTTAKSQSQTESIRNQTVTISAELFIDLSEKLTKAESRISNLEANMDRVNELTECLIKAEGRIKDLEERQSGEQNQLTEYLKQIEHLEKELKVVKKDNHQLKELTGPKISDITKQLDQMKYMRINSDPPPSHFNSERGNVHLPSHFNRPPPPLPNIPLQNSFSFLAGRLANSDINHPTPTNTGNKRIEFEREKCFVIDDIKSKDQVSSDDNIRKIVGNQHKVVIDRISRSRNGKIFVQLGDQKDVEQVIKNWNQENFGGSTISKSEKPQRKLGVLKGVPLYMTDEDIQAELQNSGYKHADVKRITKQGSPTRALRVRFDNSDDLEKAIKGNVVLQNLVIRVEELVLQPRVTQCYNCYKYNHIAEKCEFSKTCSRCSELYDESHESCEREKKCLNCKGPHSSSDRQCPIFIKMLHNQRIRLHNFYNNNQDD